jgi:hypothetical protein
MKQHIQTEVKKRVKGEARKKVQMDKARIDDEGREILDSQPLFADIGTKAPPSLNERIRQTVQQVQAQTVAKLQAQNMTDEQVQRILDEEDDFEMPDEIGDILTLYEAQGLVANLSDDAFLEPDLSAEGNVSAQIPEASPPPAEQSAADGANGDPA